MFPLVALVRLLMLLLCARPTNPVLCKNLMLLQARWVTGLRYCLCEGEGQFPEAGTGLALSCRRSSDNPDPDTTRQPAYTWVH
jgi:hypothetical protein